MRENSKFSWYKHLDFIFVDIVAINLSFVICHYIKNKSIIYTNYIYFNLLSVVCITHIIVGILRHSYSDVMRRDFVQELQAIMRIVVSDILIITLYLFSFKIGFVYSRLVVIVSLLLSVVIALPLRQLNKIRVLHSVRKNKKDRSPSVVISDKKNIHSLLKEIRKDEISSIYVKAVVVIDDEDAEPAIFGVEKCLAIDNVAEYICHEWVDDVFIQLDNAVDERERLIDECYEMGVTVHNVLKLHEVTNTKQFISKIGSYTILTTNYAYISPFQYFCKRTMDIVGGLIGCLLTLIVMLIVGGKIKKASPGPIIYSQYRIGKNGKKFKIYKLRSMYLDADARKAELMKDNIVSDGMMFKMDFDPRIIGNEILPDGTHKTGIGEFIRKTSLDEFPQFFNVLKGDMSLVGTRPPTVDEWEKYKFHHRARMAMKPGITGMWQTSGRSKITDFEEVVKLDTYYISNYRVSLDIKILFKTVMSVLKHEGAM